MSKGDFFHKKLSKTTFIRMSKGDFFHKKLRTS